MHFYVINFLSCWGIPIPLHRHISLSIQQPSMADCTCCFWISPVCLSSTEQHCGCGSVVLATTMPCSRSSWQWSRISNGRLASGLKQRRQLMSTNTDCIASCLQLRARRAAPARTQGHGPKACKGLIAAAMPLPYYRLVTVESLAGTHRRRCLVALEIWKAASMACMPLQQAHRSCHTVAAFGL